MALIAADEIRVELANTSKSDEDKLSIFTDLFMAYGDALEAIRSELKQVSAKNEKQKSTKSENEEANLQYLLKYISYLKLTKTIERNEILVSQLKKSFESGGKKKAKPEELVRIYDNLIQNYKELQEIADENDVENNKVVAAKGLSCRAARCRFMAHSYSNNKEWANALGLLDRCTSHIGVAKEHHLDCLNHDKAEISSLEQLQKQVDEDRSFIKTKIYLESLEQVIIFANLNESMKI